MPRPVPIDTSTKSRLLARAAREFTDGREVDVVFEHDGAGDEIAKAAEHLRAFPSR